jgi:hypothetical protein
MTAENNDANPSAPSPGISDTAISEATPMPSTGRIRTTGISQLIARADEVIE